MKLGDLQAQMMRLDNLGERLASLAGLKPQELPAGLKAQELPVLEPRSIPGRGGPASTLRRDFTVDEFTSMLNQLTRQVDERSDQLGREVWIFTDSAAGHAVGLP